MLLPALMWRYLSLIGGNGACVSNRKFWEGCKEGFGFEKEMLAFEPSATLCHWFYAHQNFSVVFTDVFGVLHPYHIKKQHENTQITLSAVLTAVSQATIRSPNRFEEVFKTFINQKDCILVLWWLLITSQIHLTSEWYLEFFIQISYLQSCFPAFM